MKGLIAFGAGKVKAYSSLVLALAISGGISTIQAQSYNFSSLNSSVSVTYGGPLPGVSSWLVDGQNQAAVQWDWFRIGPGGGESPINLISLTPTVATSPNSLDVTYDNGIYSARVVYTLTGSAPGSGHSSLSESITFMNKSGSPLDLHFFDYSDYNLGNTGPGQFLQFYKNGVIPGTNSFFQTFGTSWLTNTTASGLNAPTHFQADGPTSVLNSLNDGSPTTLNDTASSSGDVSGAIEWDLTLASGSSLGISKLVTLQVPEPSMFGLVGLGLLAWTVGWRRFTRSAR